MTQIIVKRVTHKDFTNIEFLMKAARGDFSNVKIANIVGRNPDQDDLTATGEDVITPGGLYTFPTVAAKWYISSTVTTDNDIEVLVSGLDANYAFQVGKATLDGTDSQTQVEVKSLTGEDQTWIRFFQMGNNNATATTGTVGLGPLGATAGVPTVKYGEFLATCQRSYYGIYTIPNGWSGYMLSLHAGIQKGTTTTADIGFRYGHVDKIKVCNYFLPIHGSDFHGLDLAAPVHIPEKNDLIVRCFDASANNLDVVASAQLILLEDE